MPRPQPDGLNFGPASSKRPSRFANYAILFFLFSMQALCPVAVSGQSQIDEYRLKAAFLFHFAQFVDWPSNALSSHEGSVLFCVLGDDPFHGELEASVQGKLIAGKTVRVVHITRAQEGKACQMVFFDRNESGRTGETIAALHDMPVLTVGESDDFLREGGIIRFCMEDRKVRFEVNQEAAERAHLNISARLLLLARNVIGRGGQR